MAFRGCGKSTLVGLFCAWRLLRAPDTRILVLAADQALAVKMVAQVRRILERHPLCARCCRTVRATGRWTASPCSAAPCCATRRCWRRASAATSPAPAPTSSSATTSRSPPLRHAGEAGGVAHAPGGVRVHPGARRHAAVRRHAAYGGDDLRAADDRGRLPAGLSPAGAAAAGCERRQRLAGTLHAEPASRRCAAGSGRSPSPGRCCCSRSRPSRAAARSVADHPLRGGAGIPRGRRPGAALAARPPAAIRRRLLGPGLWAAGGRRRQRARRASMSMARPTATCTGWPG